jgi:hypothetical protein
MCHLFNWDISSRIPDIGRIPDSIEAAIRDILYPRPSQPIDRTLRFARFSNSNGVT